MSGIFNWVTQVSDFLDRLTPKEGEFSFRYLSQAGETRGSGEIGRDKSRGVNVCLGGLSNGITKAIGAFAMFENPKLLKLSAGEISLPRERWQFAFRARGRLDIHA